jgi:hypothetical protein
MDIAIKGNNEIPIADQNSPSNCSHFDVTYVPFWWSHLNFLL